MSISTSTTPLWPKVSARIAGLRTLGFSTIRRIPHVRPHMSSALYLIGSIIAVLGVLLMIPTLSRIAQASDPIMLLGAPILMNGVWLFVFGVIICALGRIIRLLERVPQNATSIDVEEGETKMIIRCPSPGCGQRLRVDRGRRGIINCPKCGSNFQAQHALS
jgi:hypothetical protein